MYLRTLGRLALEGSSLRRPKPLLLLAYLALEGSKSRRELAELFWMDSRDPRDSLSTALRRLTQQGRCPLVVQADRVGAKVRCDALDFLHALEVQQPEAALRFYGGAFVDGLSLGLGEELEEWVYGTREALASKFRAALLHLGEEALASGATHPAARYAERVLPLAGAPELEPSELGRLYALLARAGSTYHLARVRQEARNLGVTLPEPPSPPASSSRRGALPPYATSFVGRERELRQIRTFLADPSCRLLTLHGPGGIGKTRLAVCAAEEQRREERFRDGVAYVQLSDVSSAEQVAPAIAAAVGCRLNGPTKAVEQVMRFLAGRHLLLVLDNYEHLSTAAPLPAGLLHEAPDLKILATSREPLRLEEEHVFTLGGLATSGEGSALQDDREADAVRLFLQRAGQANEEKPPSARDLPHVRRICELVQGSALGIELAAAWVRALPVSEIAAEIAANLGTLTARSRNIADRHQSLHAVFEHSWNLLGEPERDALVRIAVFRGGFARDAALQVAGATLPLLASLLDKSLLRAAEGGRYDFHPLVQAYAQEKLRESSEKEHRARERHARYFCALLRQNQQALLGQARGEALSALERELENLRAAWDWAAQEGWAPELRLASPLLRHVYDKLARYREGIRLFDRALKALPSRSKAQRAARGRILLDQAHFYHYLGAHRDAMGRAQEAVDLLERYGEAAEVRDGLNLFGGTLWREGRYAESKSAYERSLRLSRSLRDARGIVNGLSYLAVVEQALGNFANAERCCRQALGLCRRTGNTAQIVIALKNYGTLLRVMGRPRQAKVVLQQDLERVREANYPRVSSDILANLALACLDLGEPHEAREFAARAVDLAATSGIEAFAVSALVALGRSETALGRHQSALTHLARAISKAQDLHNEPLRLAVLTALAESGVARGATVETGRILAYLQHQPSLQADDRLLADRLRDEMRERGAEGAGDESQFDVDEVVNELLADVTE